MARNKDDKKAAKKHPSLSEAQDEAEAKALELIRKQHGYSSIERRDVDVGEGSCRADGVNLTGGKIVEVYARVGKLRGAQTKKVATDILKLATIRQQPGFEKSRCEIYFVDTEARDSVPTRRGFVCTYLARWTAVKYRWRLTVDEREKQVMLDRFETCPPKALRLPSIKRANVPGRQGKGETDNDPRLGPAPRHRGRVWAICEGRGSRVLVVRGPGRRWDGL